MNDINLFLSGSSDPSSEDEPLINLMKKRQAQSKVKTPEKKDTRPRRLEEKHVTGRDTGMKFGNIVNKSKEHHYEKAFPSSDSSSDDDDIPLANLVDKMKSGKENTKTKAASQVSSSTKRRGNVVFTVNVVNLIL